MLSLWSRWSPPLPLNLVHASWLRVLQKAWHTYSLIYDSQSQHLLVLFSGTLQPLPPFLFPPLRNILRSHMGAKGTPIISPDEALRPDARCPWAQYRVTDDLLYNAEVHLSHMSDSLPHLMLALLASLQQIAVDAYYISVSDPSLHAYAVMLMDLGRIMSTLVQSHSQVAWRLYWCTVQK